MMILVSEQFSWPTREAFRDLFAFAKSLPFELFNGGKHTGRRYWLNLCQLFQFPANLESEC